MHQKRYVFRYTGIILIVTGLIAFGLVAIGSTKATPIISPLPENTQPKQSVISIIFPKKKNPEDLKKKIQTMIDNRWVNYSVLVVDFTSDFSMGINESVIYTGASVNKIPILAALYYGVERGEVDLDKDITIQESDIQDYGTGSIRYNTPGATYSIKTLAKLMIQQSDNTAAYVLANYVVGLDTIQKRINDWGLMQTDMTRNKTSNKDMAQLMEKIYTGKVANQSYTQEILAFFKNTDFEERLPAHLPDEAVVYHKIGTDQGALHDVGIVEHGKIKYYIGVFTSDITDDNETTKIIADVSKAVYDYMR